MFVQYVPRILNKSFIVVLSEVENTSSVGLNDPFVEELSRSLRWACGGGIKTILRLMKTGATLINTGRPLFLLAVRRQTFWPALSDAWSKIGHHTEQ